MLFYTSSCASTQDLVPHCALQAGGKHPAALLTFHQTRGRGQQSRVWESEPGKNLALSVWFPLKNPRPDTFPLLNMALTGACLKALKNEGIPAEIKWPNDLRYHSAKLAGLLMEIQTDEKMGKCLCMGIGLNVNQTDFTQLPQSATSLKNITAREHNLLDLARALLSYLYEAFKSWEKQPDDAVFLRDFNDALEGKNDIWEAETETGKLLNGYLRGIDAQGRVLLETGGKIDALHHGNVRLKTCLSQK